VVDTLRGIPEEFQEYMECLVVDNFSSDHTAAVVKQAIDDENFPFDITLIRTRRDLGYAGSQKLAYTLTAKSPQVEKVIMLHGDGQYDPALLRKFLPYIDSDPSYALVNGYRDKKTFPEKDETPLTTYRIIKILNRLENLVTRFKQKEWHSGFVLYGTSFLRKIPFHRLTDTRHIDGEMLICAEVLGEKTFSVPIYKKYRDFESFSGLPKMKYVLDVFKLFIKFRLGFHRRLFSEEIENLINYEFDRL
jgi:glycosyltransferase involved in cell wall biosynthesis